MLSGKNQGQLANSCPSESSHMTRSPHSVEFEALRLKTGLSRSEAANLLGVTERTVIRYENGDSRPSPIAIKWLQEHLARLPEKRLKPAAFRFIDLFAGIGGLRIGFDAIGGQCVFTSEWDKYSQATYRENFGNDHPIAGDIREYSKDPSMIPAHDVLLAGFPCQPFSIAGVSKKNALGHPRPQVGIRYEARIILAEDAVSVARDEIVERVP